MKKSKFTLGCYHEHNQASKSSRSNSEAVWMSNIWHLHAFMEKFMYELS